MNIKRVLQSSYYMSLRQYVWNLFINGLLMSYLTPLSLRHLVLNMLGADIRGAIHGHTTILSNRLSLGRGSFINRNCFIDNNAMVSIGEYCSIGYNVTFITSNHDFSNSIKRASYRYSGWMLDRCE